MATAAYLSFGEYLALFMEQRGYSGAALARLLGEKSATVISRIKGDQCTHARCEIFLRQLTDALGDLTEDELHNFRRGLVILRLGRDAYCAYRAIHQLFTRTPALPPAQGNLRAMLQPPADADEYDVVCMQCSDPVVTDELTALCRSYSGQLSIRHYVTFPLQTTTAQLVVSLLPILCDSRYTLTELRFADGNPGLGICAQQFIFTRCMRRGQAEYQVLLPCCDGSALRLSIADGDSYERCLSFIHALDCARIPLNERYTMDSPVHVLAFLSTVLDSEKNRAACIFKRDFCFSCIPLDVLQSAFNDMLLRLPASYAQAVTDLRRLCYARQLAFSSTSKPIRLLLSRSGVQRFLQTGKLSNHFFGLRPFSMDERRQILAHIIELAGRNPNITLHFAHDESLFQEHTIFIYEKSCVRIMPARTDYQPPRSAGRAHKTARLTDPLLADQLTAYFLQYLLPEMACPPQESLDYLRGLLRRMA